MKKIKNYIFLLLLITFTAIITTGCSKNAEDQRKINKFNEAGTIKIGAAAPWNELKKEKILLKEGIELATEKINRSNGINGKKIEIIWKDDLGTVRQGKVIAEEFSKDPDLIAVIGHYNSAVSVAASVLYEHSEILMITPASTTPKLTERSGNKLIFMNIPSDDAFAKDIAYYIANTGFKHKVFVNKILIYNEDSLYGNDLAAAFEKYITSHRIKVVARRLFDTKSDTLYFKNDLEHIDTLYKFDAIFISGLGEKTSILIEEVRRLGLNIPVFCGEGVTGNELIEMIGIDAEDTVYCSTYDPNVNTPETVNFKKKFKNRYKIDPDSMAVQGYDTLMLLASAMKKANSTVPDEIADSLRGINYKGLMGPISFNKDGSLKDGKVVLKKIKDGKITVIDNSKYQRNGTK